MKIGKAPKAVEEIAPADETKADRAAGANRRGL